MTNSLQDLFDYVNAMIKSNVAHKTKGFRIADLTHDEQMCHLHAECHEASRSTTAVEMRLELADIIGVLAHITICQGITPGLLIETALKKLNQRFEDPYTKAIPREGCGKCMKCLDALPDDGHFMPRSRRYMVVCSICGNKRCPHATSCENLCTGSNHPGQKGSIFEHIDTSAKTYAIKSPQPPSLDMGIQKLGPMGEILDDPIDATNMVQTEDRNLNLDNDQARALHRIVRAMHDGECPKCHKIHDSRAMRELSLASVLLRWRCPSCNFSIETHEADAICKMFGQFMERNLAVFEAWRKGRMPAGQMGLESKQPRPFPATRVSDPDLAHE